MTFNYFKHKNRFDRGRMWYAMLNSVITAFLVAIFSSEMAWYYKALSAVISFVLIYVMGFIDDKLRLLDKEQDGVSKRNPFLMEIADDIKEIKNKLL
jgi:hypothetical protein